MQKYTEEKLSTLEMGNLCKINAETIRTWLGKCNIKKRTNSEAAKERHKKNPEAIKGKYNGMWGKHHTEKTKKAISWLGRKHTEKTKRKMSENSPWWGRKHTEKVKKQISKANKGKVLSEKHKKILRNSLNKRPTKPEKTFDEMTSKIVHYVGNRAWWRKLPNGKYKNPDFKVTGQNKVIEIYGDYWHRNDDPQELVDLYKQAGLDCLIIWEHEVYKQPSQVQMKVREFILEETKNARTAHR